MKKITDLVCRHCKLTNPDFYSASYKENGKAKIIQASVAQFETVEEFFLHIESKLNGSN